MRVRERKHRNKVNRYQLAKVQYKKQVDLINQGLGRGYARAQTKLNRVKAKAFRDNQNAIVQAMQKSQHSKFLAAGRTGRSIRRIGTMEMGALGRFHAAQARNILYAKQDYKAGVRDMRRKAKTAQDQAFAKVVFNPTTDVAPPPPVMQNVGLAMFTDVLNFGMSAAAPFIAQGSDSRLKEDIKKIGTSIDGHNVYKFKYLDGPEYYTGVMAEEILKVKPEAVAQMDNGYWGVDYNQIDVEFKEVA